MTLARHQAPARSDRLEIDDDSLHLISAQVLDHSVHDRRGTKHTLNYQQLFQQIGCMLPGQARKKRETLAVRTVTGGAGRNLTRRHSLFENVLALGDQY